MYNINCGCKIDEDITGDSYITITDNLTSTNSYYLGHAYVLTGTTTNDYNLVLNNTGLHIIALSISANSTIYYSVMIPASIVNWSISSLDH